MSEADIDVAKVAAQAAARAAAVPRPETPEQKAERQRAAMAAARAAKAAKQAEAKPEAKRDPVPDTWVPLEHVVFIDSSPVDIPGRDGTIYSRRDSQAEDSQRQGPKQLHIWLNRPDLEIILEDPVSGYRNRVPLSNVRSYRRVGDLPGFTRPKVSGMVTTLADYRAPGPNPPRGMPR